MLTDSRLSQKKEKKKTKKQIMFEFFYSFLKYIEKNITFQISYFFILN